MYMHEFQCLEWALEEYALLSGSDYLWEGYMGRVSV